MNKLFLKGQSLWEVIIALGVAGLIALGLVKAMVSSIKSSRFSRDQSQMTALAQTRINQIIDYKNKNRADFWSCTNQCRPPLIPREEYNVDEDYCLLTEATDKSINLPPETPDYANARMVMISVDAFWELKSSVGVQCDHKDFSHKLHFETYVTN